VSESEAGSSCPWVLLRGLGREAAHWGDFADKMKAAFPGATVLTPDLPGCGTELAARPAATVAGILERMRTCVAAAGPVRLLGLSLGGMIALEWMRLHPQEVAGAVLINTSAGGVSAPWRRLRPGAAWRLVRAALAADLPARERHVFSFTSRRAEREAELTALWAELARARPVSRSSAARQLVAAARFRLARAATPLPPTLVLVSENDGMVSPTCSRAVAARLGCAVSVHATAGHDLPLDDPDWVLGEIAAWQRKNSVEAIDAGEPGPGSARV
jgi:pimeloyl-ACP methyl ester carboxylesterase